MLSRLRHPPAKPDVDSVFVGRLLLGRVMSALLEAHDKALAPFGLTSRQGVVLMNCARGEANTPVELAVFNGLDVSSMSRMLDRLEKKGLLRRLRTGADRRKVNVQLTAKGRALVRKATPVAARVAVDAWRGVTERERQILRNIVHKILGNLGHVRKS
jgi:DNA-binding MarR family transcriptional regulator